MWGQHFLGRRHYNLTRSIIYVSVVLSVVLSVCLLFVCLSVCLSAGLSVSLSEGWFYLLLCVCVLVSLCVWIRVASTEIQHVATDGKMPLTNNLLTRKMRNQCIKYYIGGETQILPDLVLPLRQPLRKPSRALQS